MENKTCLFHSDDYVRRLFARVLKKYKANSLHKRINLKSNLIGKARGVYNLEDLIYHLYGYAC